MRKRVKKRKKLLSGHSTHAESESKSRLKRNRDLKRIGFFWFPIKHSTHTRTPFPNPIQSLKFRSNNLKYNLFVQIGISTNFSQLKSSTFLLAETPPPPGEQLIGTAVITTHTHRPKPTLGIEEAFGSEYTRHCSNKHTHPLAHTVH